MWPSRAEEGDGILADLVGGWSTGRAGRSLRTAARGSGRYRHLENGRTLRRELVTHEFRFALLGVTPS